ncbi:MAG TPA: bifunctional folylpolyglutamate synthase/dihydrofolate synthase, partial [Treponemataceae bacterium]|nr:bifunctional folylpolyglutamate synthase/dihydrofolate synthase [Treponemataceae bacterium]
MKSSRQTELFCDWLENFLDYEKIRKKNSFSLDAMQFLVTRFKHPESAFRSIHVAGSKGKGSVSTMMAALVEQAGYPAGLYTSPHLVDFSERITRSGIPF